MRQFFQRINHSCSRLCCVNIIYVRYTTTKYYLNDRRTPTYFLLLIQEYVWRQGKIFFYWQRHESFKSKFWRKKNNPIYSTLQFTHHTWLSRRGERRGVGREVWLVQMIVGDGGDGGRAGEGQRHPRAGRDRRGGERTPGLGRPTARIVDVVVVGAQVGECPDLVAQDPGTNHSGHQYKHAQALKWHSV